MSEPNHTTSIIDQFRAAGRLVNEWRDTLFYSALITESTKIAINTNPLAGLQAFTFFGAMREVGRSLAWRSANPMVIAGYGVKYQNTKQLFSAAAFGATVFMSYPLSLLFSSINQGHNLSHKEYIGFIVAEVLIQNGVSYFKAGGLGNIYRAYKDIMWDYPRKNGGGGMTQTQKLIYSIFGKQVKEAASEAMVFAPALPSNTQTRSSAKLKDVVYG